MISKCGRWITPSLRDGVIPEREEAERKQMQALRAYLLPLLE